ncbi:MAG: ATP synthase F1 subunit epsilon [Thermoguttaceae bacterium]|jgi:F-type H+-transporting ATPase subunit epsilon|nr:ATP synthase F1 subunit epsilon [Thermoguttaceae bacterium]
MSELRCIVVTPERTARDEPASFVALPLFDGEIGIAPGRIPLIGRLGFGELRITGQDGRVERYYVEGGFVEVMGNVVSVLTGRAVPAEELDEAVSKELLDAARERVAHSPEAMAVRERAVVQARAQLRVARRARIGGTR